MPRMRENRSHLGYRTRALASSDPRFAKIFESLAPRAPRPKAKAAPPGDLFPHPAAALADEAGELTYADLRERAERLLEGEDLPRSKVGIVEALRARAAE